MRRHNGFYWLRSVERKDGQRIYRFYRVGDLLVWVFSLMFALLVLGFFPGVFAVTRFPVLLFGVITGAFAVLLFLIRRIIKGIRARRETENMGRKDD